MSEIQRLPHMINPNPVHPNAKTTTQITNGTTTTKSNIGSPVCRNCKTQTTPLWRRDETGQVLCNACGLFLKLHGRPRPISLKTDTIKSRNRIKQPNFSKSSGPNTPELKSKDAKIQIQPSQGGQGGQSAQNGRHSPLSAAKKRSPNGSPLDAANGAATGGYVHSTGMHSPLQPSRAPFSGYPSQMGALPGLPHQVQSLHYPSSTPAQFAPGLQRITSPLLLSTTPSVSNARSSNGTMSTAPASTASITSPPSALTAMQAAGALENMSNELGPSASFKGSNSAHGVSLMGRSNSPSLSTPSSALRSSPKPQLPALGSSHESSEKSLNQSSFASQFSLKDSHDLSQSVEHPMPALPPLHNVGSAVPPQLPHISSNLGSAGYSSTTTPEKQATPVQTPQGCAPLSHISTHASSASGGVNRSSYGSGYAYPGPGNPSSAPGNGDNSGRSEGSSSGLGSGSGSRNGQDEDRVPPNNNSGTGQGSGASSYEVNVLKTRISELELVNDLYRTRIMELEAMEQAARLRENSMRKRLDDMLKAQGYNESSSMLNSTMRIVKRADHSEEDASKRLKTE